MAAEGGDGEVIGWERFFNEVQSLIRCSEMRIGRADRSFSLHIIERLQMATENIAAIGCLLNSATELREYCQCLGDLIEAIHGIILEWELHLDRLDNERERTAYRVGRCYTGHRGRPKFHVSKDQLVFLRTLSFSWTKIASLLGISRVTVYRHQRTYGLLAEGDIIPSDQMLRELLRHIRLDAPDLGQTLLLGRLRAMGYRVTRKRLREMVRAQDPLNTALRMPGGLTARMKYSVAGPNSLWHIGK